MIFLMRMLKFVQKLHMNLDTQLTLRKLFQVTRCIQNSMRMKLLKTLIVMSYNDHLQILFGISQVGCVFLIFPCFLESRESVVYSLDSNVFSSPAIFDSRSQLKKKQKYLKPPNLFRGLRIQKIFWPVRIAKISGNSLVLHLLLSILLQNLLSTILIVIGSQILVCVCVFLLIWDLKLEIQPGTSARDSTWIN